MEKGKKAARYRVLPPSASLTDEAARGLLPDGLDFSRNCVVFPGKRPAHFLRKVVAQAVGSAYIPPAVFSMEELVDHVYEKIDGGAAAKIETIDAIAFLFDLHRSMKKPLGGREFLSLEAFFPLGLRIYRDIEELLIEGVEPARLRDVEPLLQAPLPPRTGGGLQSLSFFYEGFYPTHRQGRPFFEVAALRGRIDRYIARPAPVRAHRLRGILRIHRKRKAAFQGAPVAGERLLPFHGGTGPCRKTRAPRHNAPAACLRGRGVSTPRARHTFLQERRCPRAGLCPGVRPQGPDGRGADAGGGRPFDGHRPACRRDAFPRAPSRPAAGRGELQHLPGLSP